MLWLIDLITSPFVAHGAVGIALKHLFTPSTSWVYIPAESLLRLFWKRCFLFSSTSQLYLSSSLGRKRTSAGEISIFNVSPYIISYIKVRGFKTKRICSASTSLHSWRYLALAIFELAVITVRMVDGVIS